MTFQPWVQSGLGNDVFSALFQPIPERKSNEQSLNGEWHHEGLFWWAVNLFPRGEEHIPTDRCSFHDEADEFREIRTWGPVGMLEALKFLPLSWLLPPCESRPSPTILMARAKNTLCPRAGGEPDLTGRRKWACVASPAFFLGICRTQVISVFGIPGSSSALGACTGPVLLGREIFPF